MKKNIDMTQGTPWRLMVAFAIPILLSTLLEQCFGLADAAVVGRYLGVDAIAATSCTGTLSAILFGLSFGMVSGLVVIVSQRFGAKDYKGLKDSVAICITISLVLSITLTVIGCIFARDLIELINVPENIIDTAYKYLLTVFIGSFATVLYVLFSSILRAIGDSKTPLVILAISAGLNVILNIIFIGGFGLGVVSAGVATIIARIVSCTYCIIYTYKKFPILRITKENFKFDPTFLKAHIKLSTPMALQYSVFQIGGTVTSSFINPLGTTALTSFSIANHVKVFPVNTLSSVATATSTFVGQNVGAGNYERVKTGVKTSTVLSFIVSILGTILIIATSNIFVHIIAGKGHPDIESYTLRYLITVAPSLFAQGIIYAFRTSLVAMGKTMLPFIFGFFELGARIATAAILIPRIGFDGAGISYDASLFTMAILSFIAYVIHMRKHYGTAFKTQKESA